jgi:hypothetical protein
MERKDFHRKFAAIPPGAVPGHSWLKLDDIATLLNTPEVYQKLIPTLPENSFHAAIVPAGFPKKTVFPILIETSPIVEKDNKDIIA